MFSYVYFICLIKNGHFDLRSAGEVHVKDGIYHQVGVQLMDIFAQDRGGRGSVRAPTWKRPQH